MTMMSELKSRFGRRIVDYVQLQRNLGLLFHRQAAVLRAFDHYAHEQQHTGPLTQELAFAFATHRPNVSSKEAAYRYQFVRRFADYLVVFEPETQRIDPKLLRPSSHQPPRHIFTNDQLTQLLNAARVLSPANPILGVTLHMMVGLAACTGLRVGEVVRLDKQDVDLHAGVLVVRRTKFKKDRLVPVHSTALKALRRYVAERDRVYPQCQSPAFFINLRGQRFARNTVEGAFWRLLRQIGLRGPTGKGPSFHSLRHTFAVMCMIAWYEQGVDVQAMLPALATYMGHVRYSDTAYYITATAELMGLAAGRYYGSISPTEVRP